MTALVAVHVVVSGAVQGVGYRAFVEREAVAVGLSGWVRNRRDGTLPIGFSPRMPRRGTSSSIRTERAFPIRSSIASDCI